jgi:hypothetical protein
MKLLLSSVSSSGAKSSFASVFKAIGWDLVRIIAFDLFTTLAMYMTYISSGTYSIIVAFLMLAMFAGFIKYIIVHIDSPLSPALFRTMHSAYDRAGKVIFSGSHKYKKSLSMLSSNPVERSSNSPSKYNVEGRNMHEDFKQRAQDYRHVDSLLENNTKNVDTSLLGKAKDRFANNMPEVNEDGKINHSKDQHKL